MGYWDWGEQHQPSTITVVEVEDRVATGVLGPNGDMIFKVPLKEPVGFDTTPRSRSVPNGIPPYTPMVGG